jgi:O-antigen ligase
MKLLKILIITSLIIFPFGELLRLDLANNITLKPLDLIAGAITVVWLFIGSKKLTKQELWYYFLFPVIALIALLVSLIWLPPEHFLSSALYLVRWISYLGVFFAIKDLDKAFKKKIIPLLFIDGIIIVLLGYLQYFFFSSLKPLYYLGWDDHMYRLFSVFLDPNYTGALLVLYLLFLGGILYDLSNKKNRSSLKVSLFKTTIVPRNYLLTAVSITSIFTLIALFLTFSRSSLLMLLVGVSSFFILIGKKKYILILLTVLLVFIAIISSKFYVENINLLRKTSTNARIGNYEVAMSIIKDHPFLGIGFNTYRYAKEYYHIKSNWTNAPSHADAGVDNSFLFVLVTTGIVGLCAYFLLWWKLLRRAFIHFKKYKNGKAAVIIASGVGLFIHALFINSLFFPAIMFWMWVQMGLMEQT